MQNKRPVFFTADKFQMFSNSRPVVPAQVQQPEPQPPLLKPEPVTTTLQFQPKEKEYRWILDHHIEMTTIHFFKNSAFKNLVLKSVMLLKYE